MVLTLRQGSPQDVQESNHKVLKVRQISESPVETLALASEHPQMSSPCCKTLLILCEKACDRRLLSWKLGELCVKQLLALAGQLVYELSIIFSCRRHGSIIQTHGTGDSSIFSPNDADGFEARFTVQPWGKRIPVDRERRLKPLHVESGKDAEPDTER